MINNFPRHLPKLRADVLAAFRNHDLDVLCLNEVGEINIGLTDALKHVYPKAKQPVVAMFDAIVSDLTGSFAVYAHSHYVREGVSERSYVFHRVNAMCMRTQCECRVNAVLAQHENSVNAVNMQCASNVKSHSLFPRSGG